MDYKQEDIDYILSGSGCSNLFEMRLAYDALRNYMYAKHGDAWDARKVAQLISQQIYASSESRPFCACKNKQRCCQQNIENP